LESVDSPDTSTETTSQPFAERYITGDGRLRIVIVSFSVRIVSFICEVIKTGRALEDPLVSHVARRLFRDWVNAGLVVVE